MSIVNGVVASLVGGAIGAAAWMGVSYSTDYEIGWLAWGIGALAGAGMSLGLKGSGDMAAGVVAALIALTAVFGGKYGAVHFAVQKSLGEFEATPIGAHDLHVWLADEVVGEWDAEGREIQWPAGMTMEEAHQPQDYPAGVWEEAVVRYDALSPAERTRMEQEIAEQRSGMLRGMQAQIATAGFQESLGPYDLLWAGLAVATAFRLASRRKETESAAPAA